MSCSFSGIAMYSYNLKALNCVNLKIQLIEFVNVPDNLLEQKSWQREKYWQAQLYTLSQGSNSSLDWYGLNRKSYRKWLVNLFPKLQFYIVRYDYYLKYYCKTFYFTIWRAMKKYTWSLEGCNRNKYFWNTKVTVTFGLAQSYHSYSICSIC